MIKTAVLLAFTLFLNTSAFCQTPLPKFKRALVMSGGGSQPGQFIGILESLRKSGWEPDVIIGTCGGALISALAQAIPSTEGTKEFFLSPDMFQMFAETKMVHQHALGPIGLTFGKLIAGWNQGRYPNLLTPYIFELPEQFNLQPLEQNFTHHTIPIIIVGTEALYPLEDSTLYTRKTRGRKLFKEVLFTDPKTATRLEGFKSPIGRKFSKSSVARDTRVITDFTLNEAARISLADPYLFNPSKIDDVYYLGGLLDLFPIELAHFVADEVVMTYPNDFDMMSNDLFQFVFGFDITERVAHVRAQYAYKWVDGSRATDKTDEVARMTRDSHFEPDVRLGLSGVYLENAFPKTFDEYLHKVKLQIQAGTILGGEAVQAPVNGRLHIRTPGRVQD